MAMRRRFMTYRNTYNLEDYMYFTILENGNVTFRNTNAFVDLQYSINNGPWEKIVNLAVKKGDVVALKARGYSKEQDSFGYFSLPPCNLGGNIMSLYYGDDAKNHTQELMSKQFAYLFYKTSIVSVAADFLPATTLTERCYESMFQGCTRLTTAPKLPSTTLAGRCYYNMFNGCTSLTTAPELPATTLANSCYDSMFQDCAGLTTAPTLPATILADSCYKSMFNRCSSLTTAPVLPATKLANYCYYYMFSNCSKLNYIKMLATDISASYCLHYWTSGVASTGTFVKDPSMTSLPIGVNGIPSGWTVVNDGEESGGLITFTIDGVEYQAEEGMTWEEWINSEYNIDMTFGIDEFEGTSITNGSTYIGTLTEYVEPSDLIIANYEYILTR